MEGLKDIYIKHALNKDYWLLQAKELRDSAQLLWDDYFEEYTEQNECLIFRTKHKTAILLMAMSLECLTKGYLIISNPLFISEGKLNKKLANHNLGQLFELAKIEIPEYELEFLKKLSKSIIWHGRYIVPKKHEEHVLEFYEMIMSDDDFHLFSSLYSLVYEKLNSK